MKKILLAFVAVLTMFAFTACAPSVDRAVDKVVKTSIKVEKVAEEKGSKADFDEAVKEYEEALKALDQFDKKEYSVEQMEQIAESALRVTKAGVSYVLPF